MTKQKEEVKVLGIVDQATLMDLKRVALEMRLNQSQLITQLISFALPVFKERVNKEQ